MILMFITNNIEVAQIAERAGVDRIFIDLETVGKQEPARRHGYGAVSSYGRGCPRNARSAPRFGIICTGQSNL